MQAAGRLRPGSHPLQIRAYCEGCGSVDCRGPRRSKVRQCVVLLSPNRHSTWRLPRRTGQLSGCMKAIENDKVSVEVISQQDIDATADLLARAFSEAIDRENYRRFLEKEIRQYLRVSITELSDDCVIFVAKASQTAVSRDYQRQGIASQLLKTCEDHCRKYRQETMMCLQVRWKDTPASQLYRKFNYQPIKRDWPIVKIFKEPQDLLAKDLSATASQTGTVF